MKKTKLVLKLNTIARLSGQQLARAAAAGPGSQNMDGCSGTCITCGTCTVDRWGCSCYE